MKKVRLLMKTPPTNWDAKAGPPIGDCNDIYFLKNEPWLEIKISSIAECKKDGVIPWIRSGARGAVLEAEELGYQIIIGPNCVFSCSNRPEYNKKELESPAIHRLLMSDEDNADKARSLCKYDKSRIRQVPYFMRPELYNEPYFYEHKWDVYFHVKTGVNRMLLEKFPNLTATHHGWYTYPELKYKAQHSKVCVHSCNYDNYGLAIHEISILGCPIVYDKFGMKRGARYDGIGVMVNHIETQDVNQLEKAVQEAMAMDRRKVWETSREVQSVENCLKRYRKAILDD